MPRVRSSARRRSSSSKSTRRQNRPSSSKSVRRRRQHAKSPAKSSPLRQQQRRRRRLRGGVTTRCPVCLDELIPGEEPEDPGDRLVRPDETAEETCSAHSGHLKCLTPRCPQAGCRELMPVDRQLIRVHELPTREEEEEEEEEDKGPWCARCRRKLHPDDVVVRNAAPSCREHFMHEACSTPRCVLCRAPFQKFVKADAPLQEQIDREREADRMAARTALSVDPRMLNVEERRARDARDHAERVRQERLALEEARRQDEYRVAWRSIVRDLPRAERLETPVNDPGHILPFIAIGEFLENLFITQGELRQHYPMLHPAVLEATGGIFNELTRVKRELREVVYYLNNKATEGAVFDLDIYNAMDSFVVGYERVFGFLRILRSICDGDNEVLDVVRTGGVYDERLGDFYEDQEDEEGEDERAWLSGRELLAEENASFLTPVSYQYYRNCLAIASRSPFRVIVLNRIRNDLRVQRDRAAENARRVRQRVEQ